jgi:hypothetical protein
MAERYAMERLRPHRCIARNRGISHKAALLKINFRRGNTV